VAIRAEAASKPVSMTAKIPRGKWPNTRSSQIAGSDRPRARSGRGIEMLIRVDLGYVGYPASLDRGF
jgi:hypothetical protein